MPIQSRAEIKSKFQQYDRPQQADYYNWIDSFLHREEDQEQLNRLIQLQIDQFRDQFFDRQLLVPFYPEIILSADTSYNFVRERGFIQIPERQTFEGLMKLRISPKASVIESIDFVGSAVGFSEVYVWVIKNHINNSISSIRELITHVKILSGSSTTDLSTQPKEVESTISVDPENEMLTLFFEAYTDAATGSGNMTIKGVNIRLS